MAEKFDEREPSSQQSDKVTWLAEQIFNAFPKEVSGLKFQTLDCGCIYFQRVLDGGRLGSQVGIYRDGDDGPCEVCMHLDKEWEDRVVDETLIYKTRIETRAIID